MHSVTLNTSQIGSEPLSQPKCKSFRPVQGLNTDITPKRHAQTKAKPNKHP